MSRRIKHFYEFGPYRVDSVNRRLLQAGELCWGAIVPSSAAVASNGRALANTSDVVEITATRQ